MGIRHRISLARTRRRPHGFRASTGRLFVGRRRPQALGHADVHVGLHGVDARQQRRPAFRRNDVDRVVQLARQLGQADAPSIAAVEISVWAARAPASRSAFSRRAAATVNSTRSR
jgi:hypothetical protein